MKRQKFMIGNRIVSYSTYCRWLQRVGCKKKDNNASTSSQAGPVVKNTLDSDDVLSNSNFQSDNTEPNSDDSNDEENCDTHAISLDKEICSTQPVQVTDVGERSEGALNHNITTPSTSSLESIQIQLRKLTEAVNNNNALLTRVLGLLIEKESKVLFLPGEHNLPLGNKRDVEEFEKFLQTQENKTEFMRYLGGLCILPSNEKGNARYQHKVIRTVGSALFTESITCEYAFSQNEKNNKDIFIKTSVANCFRETIISNLFEGNMQRGHQAFAAWWKNFNQVRKRYHHLSSPQKDNVPYTSKLN